jgi:hypothetical protein
MFFGFLAALATTLLLAWWFMRIKAERKGPEKRLSIAVTDGIAVVTLPAAYEVEDMSVLWEFLQGQEAAANRARVHGLLYDCSEWRWSNVLGLEMVLWQTKADWTGDTIFCQLSPEMKSVLDTLLEGERVRPPRCFATVEEGLNYARGQKV